MCNKQKKNKSKLVLKSWELVNKSKRNIKKNFKNGQIIKQNTTSAKKMFFSRITRIMKILQDFQQFRYVSYYKLFNRVSHHSTHRKIITLVKIGHRSLYLRKRLRVYNKVFSKYLKFCLSDLPITSIKVFCSPVKNSMVNANLLISFLLAKLKMKYKLSTLISLIYFTYYRKMKFRGLMLVAMGRFTRAERASKKIEKRGFFDASSLMQPLDFWFGSIALKYGACSLKIFLSRRHAFFALW